MNKAPARSEFSIPQLRAIVADLFDPNPWVYWADFLVSLVVGYVSAGIFLLSEPFAAHQIIAFFVAAFSLHRVSNFIHEVAHVKKDRRLRAFRVTWDLLAGVPMLTPS